LTSLGDAGSFLSSNFQAWSWAEYDDHLFVGVARPVGSRVMYTDSGSAEDGAWVYSVGGDAEMPDGFDGVGNFAGFGANLGSHMYTFDQTLYAGTMVNAYSPALFSGSILDGADIWRATGPAGSLVWSRVTGNGFGDGSILSFESFCSFDDSLYVAGSNLFGNFDGDQLESYGGAVIFRLKQAPEFVAMNSLTVDPGRMSVTISWQTGSETGVEHFNIYRSTSEEKNKSYRKVNRIVLSAGASPYSFTDRLLRCNTTYYYKVEAVSASGESSFFGPLPATTRKLLGSSR